MEAGVAGEGPERAAAHSGGWHRATWSLFPVCPRVSPDFFCLLLSPCVSQLLLFVSLFLCLGLCFLSVCLSAHPGILPHTRGPRPGPSSAPGQRGRHPDCRQAAFCPLACDGEGEGRHVAGPLNCAGGRTSGGCGADLGGRRQRVHSAVYSPEAQHRFFPRKSQLCLFTSQRTRSGLHVCR